MRVLVTSAGFEPGYKGGGPIRSVSHIISNAPADVDIILVTRDRDLGDTTPYDGLSGEWRLKGRARIFYLDINNVRQWLKLLRTIRSGQVDLLYLNSLFAPSFSIAPVLAARLRLVSPKRVLIAPRGELSPGALELKPAKKRAFLKVWRTMLGGLDVTWHASADLEATDIRTHFPAANVLVSQDQSSYPPTADLPDSAEARARFVFVGRISPKKNLAAALTALKSVRANVTYDIYGPIEDERYWKTCTDIIDSLPANVSVRYQGMLEPDQVRPTFAGYDAFVFPTAGENFGHVIAESLSVSCPVVCSDQTPWTAILKQGGGWVTGPGHDGSLETILQRLASWTPEERLKARQASAWAYAEWRKSTSDESLFNLLRSHSSNRTSVTKLNGE